MLKLVVAFIAVGLSGCELLEHGAVVAPKPLVENCLQEAYAASTVGFGPYCAGLNEWAKLHGWFYGGGPPIPSKPTPQETHDLVVK